jgi:aspartate aminotransferase-like enzyme
MSKLLMIPGPVEIPQVILDAFNGQNVAHYGPEWQKLYLDAVQRTTRFFQTSGRAFLMPGSGSLGLEAVAVTFCTGKRCLLIHNGFFADRFQAIATPHAACLDVLDFGFAQPVDLSVVEQKLGNDSYDVVLMIHAETSTAMLNPAEAVAKICHDHGVLLLLDAIASGGVEPINMDKANIGAMITASQKGFACPAGLAIVVVSQALTERMANELPTSWYCDLRIWNQYYLDWYDWHPFPVTLPTNLIKAYHKSLTLLEAEGKEQHWNRFANCTMRVRRALQALGLKLLIDDDHCTHGLTAVSTKGMFDSGELVSYLKDQWNIQIAGSLGKYKNEIFRIGHFSDSQIEKRNLLCTVVGIGTFLQMKQLAPDILEAIAIIDEE